MIHTKQLFGCIFAICGSLYMLLYLAYIFYIDIAHSSYSIISVPAILLPFIVFLLTIPMILRQPAIKNNKKAKTILSIITILGTIPVLICTVLLGINESKSKFTAEKWERNHSDRVYMVDDLIDTHDLKGMNQNEVIILLGEPTDTEYFQSEGNMVYYLGDERGFISIDSEWLIIEFDHSEKVKNYFIATD